MSDFNNAANKYDYQFTNTRVGIAQREEVWHHIKKIDLSQTNAVLEINCGTGEDAKRWSNLGKKVLATDLSEEMIKVSKNKFPEIQFSTLDARNVGSVSFDFDFIFSNFGGLNCLSKEDLNKFFENGANSIKSEDKIAAVIMGKKCLWDKLFLTLKGKWKLRNRRNTESSISVNVDGTNVSTWYFSPKEIKALVQENFSIEKLKPIGLFVPPSYLSRQFEKKKVLIKIFTKLDKWFSFGFLSNYADHYLIVLSKR